MKKLLAFSLIELMIVVALVAILSAIAVPSYREHITKIKFAEIFTLMGYHKIHLAAALFNADPIEKTYHNPTNSIIKLTLKTIEPSIKYIIQAEINTKKLNLKHLQDKPLLINLIGTYQEDFLIWHCQMQTGYHLNITENCSPMELAALP